MSLQQLNTLINKLKGLESFIQDSTDEIISKNRTILLDENRRQLEDGKDSEDKPIEYQKSRIGKTGHYGWYSKGYEKYKEAEGGEVRYVDLYLTGDFYRSIVLLHPEKLKWTFESVDTKYKYLVVNYGEKILGVTEEFLDYFCENILQFQIQTHVDQYLA